MKKYYVIAITIILLLLTGLIGYKIINRCPLIDFSDKLETLNNNLSTATRLSMKEINNELSNKDRQHFNQSKSTLLKIGLQFKTTKELIANENNCHKKAQFLKDYKVYDQQVDSIKLLLITL